MPSVYSTRFVSINIAAGGGVVWDCPADRVAIVSDIAGLDQATTADGFLVVYAAGTPIYYEAAGGFARSFHWSGHQVLAPGDELAVEASDGAWGVAVSGYLLVGALPTGS